MTEDGKLRLSTLAEAEAKLLNDAPLLPLYHSVSFNVLDPNALAGWFQNPLDIHPFKALSFGAPKARPFVAKAASQAP
jgi:peptide/nickel transport system substrate-binding protein/oligopeptide transport system substrate-binding protein